MVERGFLAVAPDVLTESKVLVYGRLKARAAFQQPPERLGQRLKGLSGKLRLCLFGVKEEAEFVEVYLNTLQPGVLVF